MRLGLFHGLLIIMNTLEMKDENAKQSMRQLSEFNLH